jgi:hypothetical protein
VYDPGSSCSNANASPVVPPSVVVTEEVEEVEEVEVEELAAGAAQGPGQISAATGSPLPV